MPLEDRKCNVTKAPIMCQALNLVTSFDDHKDTTRSELVIHVLQKEKLSLYKMPCLGQSRCQSQDANPVGRGGAGGGRGVQGGATLWPIHVDVWQKPSQYYDYPPI